MHPIFLLLNRLYPVMVGVSVRLTESLTTFDYIQNIICFLFILLFGIGVQVCWWRRWSGWQQNIFILSVKTFCQISAMRPSWKIWKIWLIVWLCVLFMIHLESLKSENFTWSIHRRFFELILIFSWCWKICYRIHWILLQTVSF